MYYPIENYVVSIDETMNMKDFYSDESVLIKKMISARTEKGEVLIMRFVVPGQEILDSSWNQKSKQGFKYFSETDFPIVIDLLRNETTRWDVSVFDSPTNSRYARARIVFETTLEPAGEGE